MRDPVALLFLTFFSVSLLAESPHAASPADPVAPNVNCANAEFVRPADARRIRPKHEAAWMTIGFTLDATARGLDAYSTWRGHKNKNNQEMILPNAVVKNQPALYGLESSIVLTEYLGYRFMSAHHHEKIARWVPFIDAASVLPVAIHNMSLIRTPATPPKTSGPVAVQVRLSFPSRK